MSENITRRRAIGTGALAALAAGLLTAAGAQAAPTSEAPADKAVRLLRRVERLMLHELRWDDTARAELIDRLDHLYDLATAADPRTLPVA